MSNANNIQVDDEVFERLKDEAEAFVDTPNSVLRRLLDLDPSRESPSESSAPPPKRTAASRRSSGKKRRKPRAPTGTLLELDAYLQPLARVLEEKGGRAPTRQVLDALGEVLTPQLTEVDREPIASGAIRWENRAQFARLELVKQGLMKKDSPRGIWELTDAGRKYASNGTPQ